MAIFRHKPTRILQGKLSRKLKGNRTKRLDGGNFFVCLVFSAVLLAYHRFIKIKINLEEIQVLTPFTVHNNVRQVGLQYQNLQNCTLTFIAPPPRRKENEWRTPLWVPSYPASGSASPSRQGDIVKEIIEKVTGLQGGVKNYHASMRKQLKRCKGISETVACSQGHPYINVGAEKQVANFRKEVIFVIRNFLAAFPASVTDKGIAYHGQKGQTPEEEWRKTRDQYLESALEAWIDMIMWWISADYYEVAVLLSYEKLMDENLGPGVIRKLTGVLKSSNFDIAPEDDFPCLLFQVQRKERQRQLKLQNYIPGYTKQQQNLIADQLADLIEELSHNQTHADLVSVLKDYHNEVMFNTRLDIEP